MRNAWRAVIALFGVCFLMAATGCNSCGFYTHNTFKADSTAAQPLNSGAARRDLSADESRGGHTLKRHVGRTDAELRERLQREPNIGAASTYTDRATAEQVVAEAIAANQDRISRWAERSSGRHPNLVLDYNSTQAVGRTLRRGESEAEACSHALVVLKFDGHGEYHVVTSYPECR